MAHGERSVLSRDDRILIRGGRVIDPADGFDGSADLLIEDGRIAARGEALPVQPGATVLEAHGLVVSPGFVDIHTHLRFPGFPEKETIRSGTAAAAAGGFTTVCAMANTSPVVDSVAVLSEVEAAVERDAVVGVRQLAAVSCDLQGKVLTDFASLARAGAVAFSDDGKPVWDAVLMRQALETARELGMAVSAHEEDPSVVRGGVANAGEVADRHNLAPWPCTGEACMVARDIDLAAATGGHLHVAHVSCRETVALLRAARERTLPVTAEVTPHHLRLTEGLLDGDVELGLGGASPLTKVNPPLRSQADVDALVAALAEGVIDAVATDHAPHAAADKAVPYGAASFGFSGLETALPLTLDLVREGCLTMGRLVECLTSGPAQVFGLESSLRPGSTADVTVFDPDERWTLDPTSMRSRGRNTPLLGRRLAGRVQWTVVQGRIVHALRTPSPRP